MFQSLTSPSTTSSPTEETVPSDWIWEVECEYGGPDHEFPHDWTFGGANGLHPGADPRWRPQTYEYYSDRLEIIHVTQTPMCDDQAIDEFTIVASYGPGFVPVHLSVRRPDGTIEMLKVRYDKATDTVTDL